MESFVITIPEAIAIVGSVVTIVLGLFGYLLKVRPTQTAKQERQEKPAEAGVPYLEGQVQLAHERISEVKDRVIVIEGDVRLTVSKLEAVRAAMSDHQARDDQDHEMFEKKLDKMMDILIKILTDDKL